MRAGKIRKGFSRFFCFYGGGYWIIGLFVNWSLSEVDGLVIDEFFGKSIVHGR
jgi:hypothetical protein